MKTPAPLDATVAAERVARTRASGRTARPSHRQGRFTPQHAIPRAEPPSFTGPLHRPGAGLPTGTDEMLFLRHLPSHGASWRRIYLQRIDSAEIIDTVHARRPPVVPVNSTLRP